eukprot:209154-Hanusia_phi.AAC.1
MIAGGGGGGNRHAAGGGAGSYLLTTYNFQKNTIYEVGIGKGGSGTNTIDTRGGNGSDTYLKIQSASTNLKIVRGGGGGGSYKGTFLTGSDGGCGGGGG